MKVNARLIYFVAVMAGVLSFNTLSTPAEAAGKKCWQEKISFANAKRKYGKPDGQYYAAFAAGKNRKNALLTACGWAEKANSAAAAKRVALANCAKYSDVCKIVELFRWQK